MNVKFLCAEVCDNIEGQVPKRIHDNWKNIAIINNLKPN